MEGEGENQCHVSYGLERNLQSCRRSASHFIKDGGNFSTSPFAKVVSS